MTVVPDEFAQPARWRAFRDQSTESEFRRWLAAQVIPLVKIIAGVSAFFWLLIPPSVLLVPGMTATPTLLAFTALHVLAMTVGAFVILPRYSRFSVPLVPLAVVVVGLDTMFLQATDAGLGAHPALPGVTAVFFSLLLPFVRTGTLPTAVASSALILSATSLMVDSYALDPSAGWQFFLLLYLCLTLVIVTGMSLVGEQLARSKFVDEQVIRRQSKQLVAQRDLIRRYVPEQVADAVLTGAAQAIEQHERRKLTIFFSDLVGFTDLSDELEPEDLAMVLHDYFTEMSAIAQRHAGTVDDLVGDAILVLFGAPESTDDHDQALRAVRMAIEMQEAMGPLNQRWESAGIPETLRVRMGVNTGVATVGNFGSAERTKYTALGKQVNVAARIQAHCEPGKVLLSHPTWLLVRDEISCTPKGELTLKGLHKPMPAYEVQT